MNLSALSRGRQATVTSVEDHSPDDVISRRLRDVGFVEGEIVRVLPYGPLGGEPILVQVGSARFALRRSEAERILITDTAAS
jgi:ferrous iron transport protein A